MFYHKMKLTSEKIQRLWEYRNSVESSFHQRNSFLLVAESMMLAAFATTLTAQEAFPCIPGVLTVFGMLLSLIWWYVNTRHYSNYKNLRKKIEELCPEYEWVRSDRSHKGPSTWIVIAHFVPLLTLLIWTALLANILIA